MLKTNEFVIHTRKLSKSFRSLKALDSLDLNVQRNSIFGFLGPNGAGKTTAMKLFLGLLRPSSGQAEIFGKDIQKESIAIRSRVGYLPQNPRFHEHKTARQVLRYAASFYFKGPKSKIEARVDQTLGMVGLEDKADFRVKGFSGGELQRLGIAQAQVHHPDLLILDEPAAALDPMGRRDVLRVMERLRKHTTILFSTHILNDVQRISDSVAILKKGELIAQGAIEDLLHGNGEMVYSIKLKGNTRQAHDRTINVPWVSSIESNPNHDSVEWLVSVNDRERAETQLLPLILSTGDVHVLDWGVKTQELESVFMNLVENEKHDNAK